MLQWYKAEKAKAQFKQNNTADLKTLLAMIPDSSVFAPERNQLRSALQGAQEDSSTEKIRTMIKNRSYEEAENAIQSHRTLWGENEDIKSFIAESKREKGRAPPDTQRMKRARNILRQGSVASSLAVFEGGGLSSLEEGLRSQLRNLKSQISKGSQALTRKSGNEALRAFKTARQSYFRIARSQASSPLSRALTQNLANAHYLIGATLYVKNACKGASHFMQAYALVPDDQKVRNRLESMRTKADQILREVRAESKTSPGTARKKARAALCLISKDSKLYGALKKLASP